MDVNEHGRRGLTCSIAVARAGVALSDERAKREQGGEPNSADSAEAAEAGSRAAHERAATAVADQSCLARTMRTGKAKQLHTAFDPKDYCDTLAELAGLAEASGQANAHAPVLVPYTPPRDQETDRPKLVVCHDYKVRSVKLPSPPYDGQARLTLTRPRAQGGYTEGGAELRRDYTFNWWQFTDTFI